MPDPGQIVILNGVPRNDDALCHRVIPVGDSVTTGP